MKAVFLDRDGTLNEDPGYLGDPDQVKLLPGVGEGLKLLHESGYVLVVVSNQSGVGRGLFEEKMLVHIHARMNDLLTPFGVKIQHFYFCIHHPDENCACRKPKPSLFRKAAADLGLDLAKSFMIGDKLSDLDAGKNAGLRAKILVKTGEGAKAEIDLRPGQADYVAETILEAARWICGRSH